MWRHIVCIPNSDSERDKMWDTCGFDDNWQEFSDHAVVIERHSLDPTYFCLNAAAFAACLGIH